MLLTLRLAHDQKTCAHPMELRKLLGPSSFTISRTRLHIASRSRPSAESIRILDLLKISN